MQDIYKKCTLFNNTDSRVVSRILQKSHILPIRYPEGKIIEFSGNEYEKLILIQEGSLAAEMRGLNGKIVRIETLTAGNAVATAILFSSEPILPVTLRAMKKSSLLRLSQKVILELCQNEQQFLLNYMKDMGDKVQFLAEKIRLFQFTTIRHKLIAHLLSLQSRYNNDCFKLGFNRETLSEIMGVTRPSLSREFSTLVNENLIQVSGRKVTLLDTQNLKLEISQK